MTWADVGAWADGRGRVRSTPAAVAIGGALGAGGRWMVGVPLDVQSGAFPWHTLIVNVVGCLLIGAAASRIRRDTPAWAFVVTGLLGGFTTMSAFGWELNDLADAGRTGLAVLYVAASVGGGLLALLLGERVASGRTTS